MAAPIVVFVQNEFYELHNPAEVPMANHPHEELLPFKTVMAASTSHDRLSVVFKWPSYHSLAYFDSDKLDILPNLDQECLILQSEASRIVKHCIDPVNLCYDQGCTINPWVHDFDRAMNHMSEIDVPDDHSNHVQRTRIRNDHFYLLSWTFLPRHIAGQIKGFPRVAQVCRRSEDQDTPLNVEVRVPSRKSVDRFEQSVSATLPDFDQVFRIDDQSATAFLKRIVPIQICYQLRKYRYFWINEHQERIHNSQPSTSGALAKLFGCVTKNSG